MAKTTNWTGATDGDWATAGNWSNGVPAAGDTVNFFDNAVDVDSSLDQTAVTIAELNIWKSYTGKIGTAAAYLEIGATVVHLWGHEGYGSPAGSTRLKLDLTTADTTVTIRDTSSTSEDENLPPVRLLVANVAAGSTVRIHKGSVGIAAEDPTETSEVNLDIGFKESQRGDVDLVCGVGCTVTTLEMIGGTVACYKAPTTIIQDDGTLTIEGDDKVTTLTINGGTCYPNNSDGSGDCIATAHYYGGTVDYTQSVIARTIASSDARKGAVVRYDPGVVTHTGNITPLDPVELSFAEGV